MTAWVVFRIEKLKSWGQVGAAGEHNQRTRPTQNAVGEIVVIKGPPDGDVVTQVRETIGSQTVRKNAVLAVEVLLSASPEYFRPNSPAISGTWEQEKLDAWREKVEPWIASKFPHSASVTLHLDEATPHYQIIDVPLSASGKLNCRGKFGGGQAMAVWQDEAAKPVAGLGIERGLPGSLARHERIKKFYLAVNTPVPELPKILTRMPARLPAPGLADYVPFSDGKLKRDKLEADHAEAVTKHVREMEEKYCTLSEMYYQVSSKAALADLARRQKKAAETTAAKLAAELAQTKLHADRIRELLLDKVLLYMYEATESADSKLVHATRRFDLPDGRTIHICGEKWTDITGAKEGRGAIGLVRHLDAVEFKPAMRLMTEAFDVSIVAGEYARQLVARAEMEVAEFIKVEPVPSPVASPDHWVQVGKWLEQVCGIPKKLVDRIHEMELLYADKFGSAVFKRQRGGAIVVGTGGSKFQRVIGSANCGPFILPPLGAVSATFLVGNSTEALALAATCPTAAVVVCGGKLLPLIRLKGHLPKGVPIFAAFAMNAAGDRLAEEALELLGAKRQVPPSGAKNWVQSIKNGPELISEVWAMDDQSADMPGEAEPDRPRPRG